MTKLKNQKGFTLIELLVVIAIIGILSAVGIPAYQGFQQKAKYNSAKTNFTNAKSFIMAEISKCNSMPSTMSLSFVDAENATQNLGINCPLSNKTAAATNALPYFRGVLWDKFKNPYDTAAGVIKTAAAEGATAATITTAQSSAIQVTNVMADLGQMSLVAGTGFDMRLTVNIGNQTGATTGFEVLNEVMSLAE
jgi:prepilin-type N-terminal cleavage/methylation domain-containing protein